MSPGRTVLGMVACAVVAAWACSGCAASKDAREPAEEEASADPLCHLLSLPLEWLERDGSTFAEVVRVDADDDAGIGAVLAFATGLKAPEAGEFAPVVEYLAERGWVASEALAGRTVPEPELNAEIEANAAALDEELASGRCDP